MADSSLRSKNFEDTIEIEKQKTSIFGEKISLWVIKVKKEFYFFGGEVAEALGYKRPRDAVFDHVDLEDKKTVEEVLGTNYKYILERIKSTRGKVPRDDFIQKIRSNQNLITELGLISFCTESRMPRAKPFQRWVYNIVKEIRETGSYSLPCGPIDNPLSLIDKVSNLEREIETFRKETRRTCDKETQTEKSVIVLDGSFRDLEDRILKALKRNKSSIKRSIKEIRLDLEKYNRASFSSSSSSPHRLYYSSDSD